MRVFVILALIAAAAGCGQTGALYLPDTGVETPVEIRTAPTTTPPSTPEDEEEKKNTQPPAG